MTDVFDQLIDTTLRERNKTIYELVEKGCLYDNVVTELQGRRIRSVDFAQAGCRQWDTVVALDEVRQL